MSGLEGVWVSRSTRGSVVDVNEWIVDAAEEEGSTCEYI